MQASKYLVEGQTSQKNKLDIYQGCMLAKATDTNVFKHLMEMLKN